MNYQLIAQQRDEEPISTMCRLLEGAVSGYSAWLKGAPGRRRQHNTVLGEHIVRISHANRQVSGRPRLHAVLHAQGQACGKKRVAGLMGEGGLSAKARKHRTTARQHEQPLAANLLNRQFTARAPNTKWVADITGVWTWEGWLSLAVVLAIYWRMLLGWAMESQREEELVEQAARMALARRLAEPGLLHHSDRGSQSTAQDDRALLADFGIVVSMSRKADGYDHALMERFIGTLKTEGVDPESYQTRQQARRSLFE
jgi:transposase InsO family protein